MGFDLLQRLARGLYYAPLPALTLDVENRVLDYNLALEVLARDELNGCRYLPLDGLVQRLAPRVTRGSLLPDGNGPSNAECTLKVEGLGSVHLTGSETTCHDSASNTVIGRIVSWEATPADGADWFHQEYREKLDHHLAWDTYATSYDRVLNLMPYYREVVARHRAALAAAAPGPVIDMGAGTGNLAEELVGAGRRITAVDSSRAMLDKLRSKSALAAEIGRGLTIVEASAEFLPMIADASFAGVSILLALFDMRAPEQALDTAVRILQPGGTLVVTDLKRSFRLDPILEECDRHLRAIGRYDELAEDLRRVVESNRQLAPGSLSQFRAEDILESLNARGFHDLSFVESHFGQCATVTGRKPGGPLGCHAGDKLSSKIANVAAVRPATSVDAPAISALYIRIYTPARDGDARDSYPFPQLMSPDAVAAMITGGEVLWLVGETPDGTIVGSAAAVRNIGGARDRIAEIFGVVVDAAYRHGGLGSRLVGGLVEALTCASKFILCEARTDDAGGWKVARNAGFRPVGYEPYAHSMPVGFESMVLTGWWNGSSRPVGPADEPSRTTLAHRLRATVMGWSTAGDVASSPADGLQGGDVPTVDTDISVQRNDDAGRLWFDRPDEIFDRSAGIVGLHPLQGKDHRSNRFTHAYYLASSATSELGATRVVYDRVDARARVLGLRAATPRVRVALVQHVVDDLARLTGGGHLVVIVLVGSDCCRVQIELTDMGFFPTAYLPAFVAAPQGRGDVIQYTRLAGCSLRESIDGVTAKDWPDAGKVISQVLGFAP